VSFELKSSLVCVGVLRFLVLCALLFPTLLLCVLCDQSCKGERLQLVEIPRKREKDIRKKVVVFKLIIGSLERG
jgi:hypothetical protein